MALISAAKQAANRANAARSTGPRSAAGKNVVRFNAVKHGMCAEHAVLPGEHEAAFDALLADLLARLAPEGDGQRCAVELAARELWRLRRGGLAETGALAQLANPYLIQSKNDEPVKREVYVLGATLSHDFGEDGFLDKLSRYEARSGRALERALRLLERLRALSAGEAARSRSPSPAWRPDPHPSPLPQEREREQDRALLPELALLSPVGQRPSPAPAGEGGDPRSGEGEGQGQGTARSLTPGSAPRQAEASFPQFPADFGFVPQNRAGLLGSVSPLALAPALAPDIRWPPGRPRA